MGEAAGPFEFVLVSDAPRTLETAVAMGFAVDECVSMGGEHFEAANREIAHHEWWQMSKPFVLWSEHLARNGPVAALARHQEALWRRVVQHMAENESALVIAHGGLIEPGLVACFPHRKHHEWGTAFRNLEGARLYFNGNAWADVQLLRLP